MNYLLYPSRGMRTVAPTQIEIRPTTDHAGKGAVLLQVGDEWHLVMTPSAALVLAGGLEHAAELVELEGERR